MKVCNWWISWTWEKHPSIFPLIGVGPELESRREFSVSIGFSSYVRGKIQTALQILLLVFPVGCYVWEGWLEKQSVSLLAAISWPEQLSSIGRGILLNILHIKKSTTHCRNSSANHWWGMISRGITKALSCLNLLSTLLYAHQFLLL